MKKRRRELTLAEPTSGRMQEEHVMDQEEISPRVVGLRTQKVFVLTALIESFLMHRVLPLV